MKNSVYALVVWPLSLTSLRQRVLLRSLGCLRWLVLCQPLSSHPFSFPLLKFYSAVLFWHEAAFAARDLWNVLRWRLLCPLLAHVFREMFQCFWASEDIVAFRMVNLTLAKPVEIAKVQPYCFFLGIDFALTVLWDGCYHHGEETSALFCLSFVSYGAPGEKRIFVARWMSFTMSQKKFYFQTACAEGQ